jgi:proteasome accessory factor C
VSVATAAEAFGVSENQLRADVELLFCCGLPGGGPGDLIDIDLGADTITVLDPQTLDRPLRLSGDEAQALLVAVRALADVPGLTERAALERVLAKLANANATGRQEHGAPEPAEPQVVVALEAGDSQALPVLRSALTARQRVRLRHLAATREVATERDVDPMRLLAREGHWYFEGWCHLAEAVRLFRVDRIESAELLAEPADPPPDAVPRDLADGLFQPRPNDTLVELELRGPARWVADYYACESVRELPDGALAVTLRTPDPGWLVPLLLRLTGRGTVVEPQWLADRVRESAEQALAAYSIQPN